MQMFMNQKILTKIALIVLSLIVISGAMAFVTYKSVEKQTQAAQWTDHTYKVLMTLESIMASMVNQETGMRGFVIAGDEKFLEPQIAGAAAYAANVAKLRELTADNPTQQIHIGELDALAKEWTATVVDPEKQFMKDASTVEKAHQIETSGAGKKAMDAIRAKVKEMSAIEASLLAKRADEATQTANNAQFVTLAGGISMVLVAILGLLLLKVSVVNGIGNLNGAMLKLAKGELSVDVPFVSRKDEVGQMAGAVAIFKQSALDNRRLEEEAEHNRRHAETERLRITAESEAAAQERLDKATSGLASALKRLADGDLSFQINEVYTPEFEGLRQDFNSAVSQLQQTLQGVVQAAEVIDAGSRELSGSANDLSKRTEQQAAALEETAAALDEITANVGNSNKLAQDARSVAANANKAARESGQVVANAVEAMHRIEQSSSQISNIIGVIDEIAFQTNLLALNAGVEAARAGDAGKGFAVVAQEVRELAQRSAQAAKEIKDLIGKSSMEVDGGVKLVRATGDALKTIETYVSTVNDHMESIAASAQEQATGLAQVNSAVNQMDQTTQQNAAMVEESNAASGSLAQEADRLRSMMQRFRLGAARQGYGEGARAATSHAPANSPAQSQSPARRMMGKVAKAFGASPAAAANAEATSWEEF